MFGCDLCDFYCYAQYNHSIQEVHKDGLNVDDTFRSFPLDLNYLTEEAEVRETGTVFT